MEKNTYNIMLHNPTKSFGAIIELPVVDIKIGKYQKALNKERAKKIADSFDIDRMRPIDVSYRDGKFWCFDGQHRTYAYRLMGKRTVPCIIHYNLSYEHEAMLFAQQQENVGSVLAHHKWNALVEAKDKDTMDICDIARVQGFTIRKSASKRNINCVKVLQDIYFDLGDTTLATILRTVATAWNFMDKSTDHHILGGLYLFVKTYRDEPKFNYERLTSRLSEIGPKQLLRDAREHYNIRGDSRRVAYQILTMYNKGRTGGRMSKEKLVVVDSEK